MSKRLFALVASTVIATSLTAAPSSAKASSSHLVKSAQLALNKEGANLSVDGKAGPNTHAAIAAYQKAHGLKVTGHLDKATRAALKTG
ncbi:MAG TPA: peptidoglycan-binding domain-containing protein [Myxococcota bacterium]|nr:peptidoglycan-binding domain-containing protein [Myxococcota bacterium]